MKIEALLFSLVIICGFIVSACSGGANDCSQAEVIAAVDQMDLLLSKFNDQVELISSTEKSELTSLISELETVLQEVQDSEVPNCILLVKNKLSQYMTTMIEGLQLYSSDNPESEVVDKIEQATDLMGDYIIASLEARVGTPTTQP